MPFFDWLFNSVIGKAVAAGLALAALVGWFAMDQRSRGAANVVTSINRQTNVKVQAARKARDRVPADGNVEWLRKHACRDC